MNQDKLIDFFSERPESISIYRDTCKGKSRYRARIILRGPLDFLSDIFNNYVDVDTAKLKISRAEYVTKRCEPFLRLNDGECIKLLNFLAPLFTDNARIPLCLKLIKLKRIGCGGAGRGRKTTESHETIYQEYLKIK